MIPWVSNGRIESRLTLISGQSSEAPHSRTVASVTFAATDTLIAATESTGLALESTDAVAGRIALAVAAVLLPVLWGLAVHLTFNWLARRRGKRPVEDPVLPDYQI